VTLFSGQIVDEFPEDGPPANRWDDLDLDAVDVLELVSVGLVREADPVVRFELEECAVWIRGHRVDVVLGPVRLTRSPGELGGPIQKKKASSTYDPGRGQSQRLHGFLIGCRRRLADLEGAPVQVIVKVSPDGDVGVRVDAPAGVADRQIGLLVDGEPVRSRDEFEALVGPPGGGVTPCP